MLVVDNWWQAAVQRSKLVAATEATDIRSMPLVTVGNNGHWRSPSFTANAAATRTCQQRAFICLVLIYPLRLLPCTHLSVMQVMVVALCSFIRYACCLVLICPLCRWWLLPCAHLSIMLVALCSFIRYAGDVCCLVLIYPLCLLPCPHLSVIFAALCSFIRDVCCPVLIYPLFLLPCAHLSVMFVALCSFIRYFCCLVLIYPLCRWWFLPSAHLSVTQVTVVCSSVEGGI